MARIRLPFECYACGKRFRNAQAVRGHRRHCRYPRLRRQAEAEAGSEPRPITAPSSSEERPQSAHNGDAGSIRHRGGPLSHEGRLLLLDVQEAIEQRCDVAGQFAFMANELARMNVAGEHAHA